jgi:hypothetical protein
VPKGALEGTVRIAVLSDKIMKIMTARAQRL